MFSVQYFLNLNFERSNLTKKTITKKIYVILIIPLVLAVTFIAINLNFDTNEVYVGIMAGHETVEELLFFIDENLQKCGYICGVL